MNFIERFKQGQAGKNKGLPLGKGLDKISKAINGLQRGMLYGFAAGAKVGKSTLVDSGWVIGPLMYAIENNVPIHVTYFSYEIDRITKEYDFASYFLADDYGILNVQLDDGITVNGEDIIEMSADYLLGRVQDDNGNIVLVKETIKEKLQEVYDKRIAIIFGRYDVNGNQISKGYITFIEEKDNPTGIRNYIIDYAKQQGHFNYMYFKDKEGKKGKRITGFQPLNPDKYNIFVVDHLRKLVRERGFSLKETIDKMIEYQVELRNWCGYTFIDIIHLNRSMGDIMRAKMMGDTLYPNSDDIKDTGNLSEEANHVFTMMNPNDDKYNLKKHFGKKIKDNQGNQLYPRMRTIHLAESRHTFYPQHFRVNMYGNIKHFEQLIIEE